MKQSGSATPVVFHFQPTHYVVVAPEQLSLWEKAMSEQVGLTPAGGEQARLRNTETWSICYGDWGWDDCDAI